MSPAAARRVSATVRGWAKKFLYDASCLGFSGRCCFPGIAGAPRWEGRRESASGAGRAGPSVVRGEWCRGAGGGGMAGWD